MSFIEDARKLLRENIRDYGMYIALLAIIIFFTAATDGLFISPRNIVNLVNQTGYIAVLAIGMTLVIVIRHIDLSVGFLAGFLGAVAAIGMVTYNLPVIVVIPLVLFFGILAGRLTAMSGGCSRWRRVMPRHGSRAGDFLRNHQRWRLTQSEE